MQTIIQSIGKAVKARRIEMGKSQAELAEALSIDLRTVQNIEAKKTVPSGITLYRIADVMNLSLDELFFPAGNDPSPVRAMLLRRINECDEHQISVLLATANAMMDKE